MSTPVEGIETVGVVGAGQMGNGIAHVFAVAGYDVVMSDLEQTRIDSALELIEGNLQRQVNRDLLGAEDSVAAMGRISGTTDLGGFGNCDLVIEAAAEIETLKKDIFRQLVEVVPERAILASNTSSISITRLATVTDRPERFMGIHFMNPVPVMKLVELIRGIATDEPTFETMRAVVA